LNSADVRRPGKLKGPRQQCPIPGLALEQHC
jgi:hypothetical protein